MSNLEAIDIAEGYTPAESEKQYIAAWQHLIDTKLAWSLQGWFGRQAIRMIDEGLCYESR
jgi:fatty acid-binding protein DegV